MRGTGIDSDVEIYATKQSNEHQYMELKGDGWTMDKVRNSSKIHYY
jgi:hypothetical protein